VVIIAQMVAGEGGRDQLSLRSQPFHLVAAEL